MIDGVWSEVGYGSRYLTSDGKLLAYGRSAALPFYVLHQTVLAVVAFYVLEAWLGLRLLIAVQIWFICAVTFGVTTAIYEGVVRRTRVTRFLFGMR